ncbi:MAG: hypothetical protein ACE5FT_05680 [Candidatus Nanoarchaeia archaeon]
MKWYEDAIVLLTFWGLYAPTSIMTWHILGKQHQLPIILSIGILAVLVYGVVRLSLELIPIQRSIRHTKPQPEVRETIEEAPTPGLELSLPLGFDNVFKEGFGVDGVRDVD